MSAEILSCGHPSQKKFWKNKVAIVTLITTLLLGASLIFPWLVPFRRIFIKYFLTIWWAVALGLLLGGVIDYYIPREYISKMLSGGSRFVILNAVVLGFLMSACSHGILALSMQLHKKGASNPAVVSFLLASPWANLTVTLMLLGFFGMKGLLIVLAALLIAINTGFIFIFLEKKGFIETNKNSVAVSAGFSIRKDIRARIKEYRWGLASLWTDCKGVCRGSVALGDMVLWWIIIGILLASLAGAYIPAHFFHKFMGPSFVGLFVTLGLATVIEVCSEGSSPLAFEIFRQTGALGNSFVFLMAGVVTDYTEIGLLWTNVGRRTALWLPVVTVPQVLVVGYLMNILFR
ncbi:MAG: permease [Candidatus Omnitrophica bacterium]|nr:permease [Candidatus Omnitrophota bacterium]